MPPIPPKSHRTCVRCGNRFLAPWWKVRQGGAKFCSRDCLYKFGKSDKSKRKMSESAKKRWKSAEERFHAGYEVRDVGECWNWKGRPSHRGYASIRVNGRHVPVHRYSWELFNKTKPDEDLMVCHTCDNPLCVNPHHLFLGTAQDNMDDKRSKQRGRYVRGESHPATKIPWHIVCQMRRAKEQDGWTNQQVSDHFKLSKPYVDEILSYRARKHEGGHTCI